MEDAQPNEYRFGPYRLRSDERVLQVDGRPIALAPKLVDTLFALVERPERVVSKAELIECIWPEGFVDEANLTQNIYILRKLFAQHASDVRIENVPKRGYRLVFPQSDPKTITQNTVVNEETPETRRPTPLRNGFTAIVRPLRYRFVAAAAATCLILFVAVSPAGSPPIRGAGNPYSLAPDALNDYLLGRYYLNAATALDLQRSVAHFTKLIAEEPQSAFGYAGLADAQTSLTFTESDPTERAALTARAIALANEAVNVASDCPDALAALGAVQATLEHDDAAATHSFKAALRVDPRNFDALVWYGTQAMNDGRVDMARRLFERALSVDPHSAGAVASLAWVNFLRHDFVAAVEFSGQLLRTHRLASLAHLTLASSYVEMGDFVRATPQITALRRYPDTQTQSTALLAQVLTIQGSARRALGTLERLEAHIDPDRVGPWDVLALAAAYARLGREETAFVWLTRIRSSERRQISRDPRFDRLRKDRRFTAWVSG